MIVKVQRALATTDGIDRVLIYDASRRFAYEGGINEDMVEALGNRPKAYFEAELVEGRLEIGEEVEAQPW